VRREVYGLNTWNDEHEKAASRLTRSLQRKKACLRHLTVAVVQSDYHAHVHTMYQCTSLNILSILADHPFTNAVAESGRSGTPHPGSLRLDLSGAAIMNPDRHDRPRLELEQLGTVQVWSRLNISDKMQ